MIEMIPGFANKILKTVFNLEESHGLTVIKQLHKIFKTKKNQECEQIRSMFESYKHCLFASLDFYLKTNVNLFFLNNKKKICMYM